MRQRNPSTGRRNYRIKNANRRAYPSDLPEKIKDTYKLPPKKCLQHFSLWCGRLFAIHS